MALIFTYLRILIAFLMALIKLLGFGAETVDIELYADPSSGYYWEHSYDKDGILILSGTHYVPDMSAIFSGGGGKQKYTFREIGEGTVNITFKYVKIGSGEVASKYVYTYHVADDGTITLINVT